MIKIAITGKANTGKNTTANLIKNDLIKLGHCGSKKDQKLMAFADPIKEIVKTMFPSLKKQWLYGSSKFRNNVIEGAIDSNGNPLTIRNALLEVGTKGRIYRDSLWLDIFYNRFLKEVKKQTQLVIVTDVRFRNEFDFLKQEGFYLIRIIRDSEIKINHTSETGQDQIKDEEFDAIINNNSDLESLISSVNTITSTLLANKNT